MLDITHSPRRAALLEATPVGDVWGIGRQYTKLLRARICGSSLTHDETPLRTEEWMTLVRQWVDAFPHSHLRYSILCHLFYMVAEYAVALKYNGLALEGSRGNHVRGSGAALSNRGLILYKMRDHDGALAAFQDALDTFTAIDFHFGVATSHNNLGHVLGRIGKWPEARQHLEAGMKYVAMNQFPEARLCEGYLLKSQGELQALNSDVDAAEISYDRARALFKDGYKAEEAEVLMLKARLCWAASRRTEAQAVLREATALATAVGNQEVVEACVRLVDEFTPVHE